MPVGGAEKRITNLAKVTSSRAYPVSSQLGIFSSAASVGAEAQRCRARRRSSAPSRAQWGNNRRFTLGKQPDKHASSLLIFPSVGYGTPDIKRVNKGVEVGSVVGYGRQVNVLSRNDPLNKTFPNLGANLRGNLFHMVPESL